MKFQEHFSYKSKKQPKVYKKSEKCGDILFVI